MSHSHVQFFKSTRKQLKPLLLGGWLVALPFTIQAATIPDFNARFEVHAFGIKLGTSEQRFQCRNDACSLKALAAPSGLASWFVNEKTDETVELTQNNKHFTWQRYLKKSGPDLDHPKKTVEFVRQTNGRVFYVEKERSWQAHSGVYDMVSIAYALQYRRLNQLSLDGLYLQDTHDQEKLKITPLKSNTNLDLADPEATVHSETFTFETSKAKVKIWLIKTHQYFPGRIEVYNKEKDKTITLLLEELPEIL